ncbi:toxin-antitoxin system, toxin component, GNAT domain protein [Lentilactobacillus parafarraginis F0439]|uniref:Toxin-antitoxin system, toxin component, GNAT domain protein n=1 Tax=Lentilactobacillus parafarraginis F0439 TaxID=797515 RepID=G9ZRF9_9LACO|nr:toxin-antitoxin system, toxin component, GNAT domain protein [Lentilactobacillus parafarraginis F0439]
MGIAEHMIEMLFVTPEQRGHGLGRRLIQYGIANYAIEEVAVNEQNPQAKGFYERMGFEVYKRTDHDEQGNPYPILYMKLRN